MSSTSKSPNVYITACLEVLQELAASSLPEGSFVELQSKYSPQNSGPSKCKCFSYLNHKLNCKRDFPMAMYTRVHVILNVWHYAL